VSSRPPPNCGCGSGQVPRKKLIRDGTQRAAAFPFGIPVVVIRGAAFQFIPGGILIHGKPALGDVCPGDHWAVFLHLEIGIEGVHIAVIIALQRSRSVHVVNIHYFK